MNTSTCNPLYILTTNKSGRKTRRQTQTIVVNEQPQPLRAMHMSETANKMLCTANDRAFLAEFEKFFNSQYLSDVTLLVGENSFFAHRLMLVKSSEVFERMLSERWNGNNKKEIQLVEEPQCVQVFSDFLRFLYCNQVTLTSENALPLLILADKYVVQSLKKVCISYAATHTLPQLSLKMLFHTWFQYATKSYNQSLVQQCILTLAQNFEAITTGEDWQREWMELDRDQLIELLKCNELTVTGEYAVWQAVCRWLLAPNHQERRGSTAAPLMQSLIPLIRFPFMTADELNNVERSVIAEQHLRLFQPHILNAYKYQALPLASRIGVREFTGSQYIRRNYTSLRWDKRITIENVQNIDKYTECSIKFTTRPSSEHQPWEWELKVHPQGYTNSNEDFKVLLSCNVVLDHTRPVEYLFQIVDDRKIVRSVAGKRTFTKTRYMHDLEVDKKVGIEELLADNSPLLTNGNLNMQITLRPID